MEQDIAILMADLSGYTALTETHGALIAADLIEKYVRIVNDCLVGDSFLHQTIGDEVLVVSSSPDHLLSTTHILMQKLLNENHFLQVHGALHYGKLLVRNNSYFGTAINLTSRITSKAAPGTFLCSAEFIDALSNISEINLTSIGRHTFKNLSDEKELFQLVFENNDLTFIDPVCRMVIKKPHTATSHPDFNNIFFCSEECLTAYMKK